jgi:serine phosphatase RsbU (regulator of sigma subunit)
MMESQFLLEPGEALTFLSDGVVEARNSSGELFGFERMLRISGSGAEAIAKAAVEFGQDDDITGLRLTRLAVGEDSALPSTLPARVPA